MNVSGGLERQPRKEGQAGQTDGTKKSRQADNPGTQSKGEKEDVMVNNYLGKAVENQSTTV